MGNPLKLSPESQYNSRGIVETGLGFLINSNYYDKGLNPYGKEYSGSVISSASCNYPPLNINRVTNLQSPRLSELKFNDDDIPVYRDNTIPNRFYVVTTNNPLVASRASTSCLHVLEEKNKTIELLHTWNSQNSSYNQNICCIIGQNSSEIFICRGDSICRFNKTTFGVNYVYYANGSNTNFSGYRDYKIIKETDEYVYLMVFGEKDAYNRITILKFNKYTYAVNKYVHNSIDCDIYYALNADETVKYHSSARAYNGWTRFDNMILKGSKAIMYEPQFLGIPYSNYTLTNADKANNVTYNDEFYNQMGRITYDFETNEYTYTPVEMHEQNLEGKQGYDAHSIHRLWTMENDQYLCYACYSATNTESNIPYQGLHVFKINPDLSLTYLSFTQLHLSQCVFNIMFSDNRNLLFAGLLNSFRVFKWNTTIHRYEETNIYMGDVVMMGFDELDRLWVEKLSDYSIHMYNLKEPAKVTLEFEYKTYIYTEEPINTFVKFEAFDFAGNHIKAKFRFTLDGDGTFDINESKTFNYNYTTDGMVQIPVTINNFNGIQCHVRFLEML